MIHATASLSASAVCGLGLPLSSLFFHFVAVLSMRPPPLFPSSSPFISWDCLPASPFVSPAISGLGTRCGALAHCWITAKELTGGGGQAGGRGALLQEDSQAKRTLQKGRDTAISRGVLLFVTKQKSHKRGMVGSGQGEGKGRGADRTVGCSKRCAAGEARAGLRPECEGLRHSAPRRGALWLRLVLRLVQNPVQDLVQGLILGLVAGWQ